MVCLYYKQISISIQIIDYQFGSSPGTSKKQKGDRANSTAFCYLHLFQSITIPTAKIGKRKKCRPGMKKTLM